MCATRRSHRSVPAPPRLQLIAVVAAAAAACGGRGADGARPARAAFPVVWDSSFHLASQADVSRRLASGSPDGADEARFDTRCVPGGPDPDDVRCRSVDTVVTRTCAEFVRLQRDGYGAMATIAVQPLDAVGAQCAAIRAIGGARPARGSLVRDFRLTPAALDSLPPVLGLHVSREVAVHADSDAARGVSWARSEPELRATVSDDPTWRGALQVDGEGETDMVQIVARGDFDGDGWDDLLVRAVDGAKGGTLVVTRVFVLTRRQPGTSLRVVRRVW